ncbi:MAG: tRNA (N6-threonylcarbamoyladenosine(37)-N6)-methyltransferase TrmO [Pseudomonadota bacterium]
MWRWLSLPGIVVLVLAGTAYIDGAEGDEVKSPIAKKDPGVNKIKPICLNPVGVVKRQGERTFLQIKSEFAPALQGIEGFSHLWVFYWFHQNDRPEERATLKVHPRRDPSNPLTGVFATRAPVRPNLIGICACRLVKVQGNVLEVADLDALDGSPILDLKPYIPEGDSIPGAATPEWLKRSKPPAD